MAIASDSRVDRAKSPEILQKDGVVGSEIAAQNRKLLATFHRTLKPQCSIALSCLRNREQILGSAMGIAIAHRENLALAILQILIVKRSLKLCLKLRARNCEKSAGENLLGD